MTAPADRKANRIMGVRIEARTVTQPSEPMSPIYAILGDGGTIARQLAGYAERKPQLDLSALVAECIADGEHGLGEAGTGVGKSLAYLVPAILSGKQTIVAVPTIALQNQLIQKDLPFLAQPGVMPKSFTYALLKGRRNYVCNLKAEKFLAEPFFERPEDGAVLPMVAEWYSTTDDGDIGKLSIELPMAVRSEITADSDECLGESCPKYAACYGERAKGRALAANVVVTNYALLMLDLKLRAETDGIVSLLPKDAGILVLDECHQLREKAANAFTEEVTYNRWQFAARRVTGLVKRAVALAEGEGRDVGTMSDDWAAYIETADTAVSEMFDHYAQRIEDSNETAFRLGDETDVMLSALSSIWRLGMRMTNDTPSSIQDTDRQHWDKARDRVLSLVDILCTIARPTDTLDTVRFVKSEGEGKAARVVLAHTPIDVAPFLRRRLWDSTRAGRIAPVVISVSATIVESGSFSYYRETVGLDNCREIMVGSPFNYQRDTLLYVPADGDAFNSSTARKDQRVLWPAYLDRMADECTRLVNLSGGRAFLLFTSRVVMSAVYDRMSRRRLQTGRLPWPLLRQGDAPMGELVKQFRATPSVLFGLKSYWEGISIDGDSLSLVVINAMPFTPPSDPVYAARCEAIDRRYGRMASFRKIAIPEATIALKQAFGRLKRTETDTGVVAILDGRLRGTPYGVRIASDLPPSLMVDDTRLVREFFSAHP